MKSSLVRLRRIPKKVSMKKARSRGERGVLRRELWRISSEKLLPSSHSRRA